MSDVLTVLYDGDCGVCSHAARFLSDFDTQGLLRLVALQTAALPDMPLRDELLVNLHARDADGRWYRGGAAWVQISRRVPILRPFSLYARLPLAMPVLDALSETVAANRHTISRILGFRACKVPARRG